MDRKAILAAYPLIGVGRCVALLDKEDYDYIRKWDWKLKSSANGRLYGQFVYKGEQGRQVFYMHHAVCTRAYGQRPNFDWACVAANGDTLDCRRANLSWQLKTDIKDAALAMGRRLGGLHGYRGG
jgi:hypothetical protein